jgi:hypothetical protein
MAIFKIVLHNDGCGLEGNFMFFMAMAIFSVKEVEKVDPTI